MVVVMMMVNYLYKAIGVHGAVQSTRQQRETTEIMQSGLGKGLQCSQGRECRSVIRPSPRCQRPLRKHTSYGRIWKRKVKLRCLHWGKGSSKRWGQPRRRGITSSEIQRPSDGGGCCYRSQAG